MMENEYLKKKAEYLYNNKPERYIIHDVGVGFIVIDTLAKHGDREEFELIPEMNRGMSRNDKRLSPQDLIDRLNELDYQVNGGLYDDDRYWVLNIKEKVFSALKQNLNEALGKIDRYEQFEFKIYNNDYQKKECEKITVGVNIWRDKRELK